MQSAFKSYVRTRDYCTSGKHVIQMCLNVIKVSIELGNYVHVNNYISKAEQTAEVQVSRPMTGPRLTPKIVSVDHGPVTHASTIRTLCMSKVQHRQRRLLTSLVPVYVQ